ncbi:hypothetical protein [Duganella vulcania]|uniref:Uncharacterized protein n=1 Tax=Duganella vulcania TaxID=2692166 RepID=A0A845GFA6_9BURK|nr:hypothetical protein [Duganella vulcania]MYM92621.1 hypothetical protein [Duganella vulcania]
MDIIDATPPSDFPQLVIIMDKELAKRHPAKLFYLRVARPEGGANHVDLDHAVTPVDARQMALAKGYEPTHWMEVQDMAPHRFY